MLSLITGSGRSVGALMLKEAKEDEGSSPGRACPAASPPDAEMAILRARIKAPGARRSRWEKTALVPLEEPQGAEMTPVLLPFLAHESDFNNIFETYTPKRMVLNS